MLRASEIISRERALDKAIDQILHTVLTSAGVQRGYLLLNRGGTLQLEASRTISPDSAHTNRGIPLDSLGQLGGVSENLALSIVRCVVRTREVVAWSTAVPDPRFVNDAYLRTSKPYAALCLPLVSQGQLTGLLAMALENALLLQRIQEATEKVHRTNEVPEAPWPSAPRRFSARTVICSLQMSVSKSSCPSARARSRSGRARSRSAQSCRSRCCRRSASGLPRCRLR